MSDKGDYSGAAIIKNAWPAWELENGFSERTWHFKFEKAVPAEIGVDQLAVDGLEVRWIKRPSPMELEVRIRAIGNPMSDDAFFFAAARMFVKIEEVAGRLSSIQGQARNLWRPFR